MGTPANALNITAPGLVRFDGVNTFSGVTTTQHDLLIGAASNGITSVAPSATSGVPVISQGASADPTFGTAVVAGGGTGRATLTNHGILVGAGTSAITQLGAGSSGQVLQSGGASADPAYSTATYPSTATGTGKVLIADGTNWVSSTPTFPNASATSGKFIRSDGTNWIASTPTLPTTAGTSGKVLISDGTNFVSSTPTFPNASASSGKFIRSDGTNWIASTPTLPTTGGTASTLLRSDGTNWVNTSAFKISSTDIMTNSAQPILTALVHTSQSNCTGDGTSVDIIFDQIVDQQGSNYNNTTGKYTCPVAGFYLLSYTVTFTGITSAMNDGNSQILSSAGTIMKRAWNAGGIRTAANESVISDSVITKRAASDTLYVNIAISNGTKVASTKADSFGPFCYLSIYLIC